MKASIAAWVALGMGALGCNQSGASAAPASSSTAPAAAPEQPGLPPPSGAPTEKDFCGLLFPPGAEVAEAKTDGGELLVKLVSNEGFNKMENFFSNQLYGSTNQTLSNKDELRAKTWDKPSPDGKCKLRVDIKGDPTPRRVHISIVRKAG